MKMRSKKNLKKTTTIALSFSLIGGMMLSLPGTVYAANSNTAKEENVYATLNEDGSVQGIYVVNAYDLSSDTNIIDYGSYTSLKNLTNENKIDENGNEITVDASKGKFYYQGDLDTKDLPWDIQIHYYLDGKEINGEELAGKSGSLKLEIALTQNQTVDASFFENYLLQTTILLPADQSTNIEAEGATVANMSGDKQILFNVMGGQEKTLTVTADVTDFEMSAISFKGVPMSFDINLDDIDTSELTDKTEELSDGVTQLNDGASELQDGTNQLQDGLTTYTSGVDSLYSGAATLASGVDTLQSGTTTYTSAVGSLSAGADTLAQKTENLPALMTSLSDAVSTLQNGSAKLADENNGAAAQITAGLNQIEDGLHQMKAGLTAMDTQAITPMLAGLEGMNTQLGELSTGLAAANQYAAGLSSVSEEYQAEADSLAELLAGMTVSQSSEEGEGISTQSEESQEVVDGEPETTTTTDTVEGEYQEDYTDSYSEESTDENGNTVVTITNNVYMTRENTTTITNDTTTNTATVVTQKETVTNEAAAQSLDAGTINALGMLQYRMSLNASALAGIVNGANGNPGLTAILSSCQSGVATGAQNAQNMKVALETLQAQITGEGGAISSVDQMIAGIETMKQTVSGDSATSLKNSLASLNGGLSMLNENTVALPETGVQLVSGIDALQNGLDTLNGNSDSLNSGITSLQSGASQLSIGANTLTSNNDTLLSGMSSLSDGMSTLKDGTQELADQTSDMDDQIMDALEDKLSNFTGQDYDGISFVSEKNTNVDAVQFAIQTQDIKTSEVKKEETPQETSNFLDKFKALFSK